MNTAMKAMRALLCGLVAVLWLPAFATTTDIYYHNDLAGTPLAATDASGNLLWRQGYKPYGERLDPKAPAEQQPWFTGKAHVEAAGLSYYGARWYDPQLGRFMGVDPKGFDEANVHSFNRYAYANNNPYRFVDPDGRVAETIFDVISLGISVEMFRREPTVGNFLGVAVDGLAVAVPFVPGGVGSIRAIGKTVEAAGEAAKGGVQANKAAGEAFERQVMERVRETQTGVVQQVTVRTGSGTKTRLDLMGRDGGGNIVCTECKASATAPLTRNQSIAFPEIQRSGAVVVGKGKPGYPGGTEIPPSSVNIVRP